MLNLDDAIPRRGANPRPEVELDGPRPIGEILPSVLARYALALRPAERVDGIPPPSETGSPASTVATAQPLPLASTAAEADHWAASDWAASDWAASDWAASDYLEYLALQAG